MFRNSLGKESRYTVPKKISGCIRYTSIQLLFPAFRSLPASCKYSVMHGQAVKYTLQAKVIKRGLFSDNINFVDREIIIRNTVAIDNSLPQLLSKEVQFAFTNEHRPVVMSASIPQSGFCIGIDKIPVEVSCYQNAKRIKVKLRRWISCESQACQFGCEQFEDVDKVCLDLSNQEITTKTSVTLHPRPLEIPCDIVPTSKINEIVSLIITLCESLLSYFLHISYMLKFLLL